VAFLGRQCMFLTSLTSWGLHCESFTLTASCIALSRSVCRNPDTAKHGLPGFPFKYRWKPPWSCHSCFLHVWKNRITWMILLAWVVDKLPRTIYALTSDCLHGNKEKHFLRKPNEAGCPGALFWKQSLSGDLKTLHTFSCHGWYLVNFWNALKASFLLSWHKVFKFI
jgi:hypothetical protein